MAKDDMASVRMPADLLKALRGRAEAEGVSLSDIMRQAALIALGVCPTCGQPGQPVGPPLDDDGRHPDGDYDLWQTALYLPSGAERKAAELLARNGIEVYRMWPVESAEQHRAATDELEASLRTPGMLTNMPVSMPGGLGGSDE